MPMAISFVCFLTIRDETILPPFFLFVKFEYVIIYKKY